MKIVSVCHRPNCNHCPSIRAHPNGTDVVIRDDYQGVVRMTKAEWDALRETKVTDL